MTATSETRQDIYTRITNSIVEQLEKGGRDDAGDRDDPGGGDDRPSATSRRQRRCGTDEKAPKALRDKLA